jgi:hypothetical protein
MKRSELKQIIKEELLKEAAIDPVVVRKSAPGYVGVKFAKKANDEDIIAMVKLKDQLAKATNTHITPVQKKIDILNKKYKV